ncbi:MAG TPA: agmatinase [bacterium]|nr:agmatinase [bacterium]
MIKPPIFESDVNFLGLPLEFSSWDQSKCVVLSAPLDMTTSFRKGTAEGPKAIIAASTQVELYDAEFGDEPALDIGVHTLPSLEPQCVSMQAAVDRVREGVGFIVEQGKIPMLLGGEHSVTIGAAQAFKDKMDKTCFVVIDAHADLRDSYHGTPLSHACASRRLWEMAPMIQVGIRSYSAEEAQWMREKPSGYTAFPARTVTTRMQAFEESLRILPDQVYISIDLDGLDPSIMPAVGTPEPGGLLWEETLDVLRMVCRMKKVVGFDIVELCPMPGWVAPDFLAAKLCYKLLSYACSRVPSSGN